MSTSINSIQLQSISSRQPTSRPGETGIQSVSPQETPTEIEMRSLPPTDHGKQAYLVLAGCTLIQAPVWGTHLLYNFSVFQLTNI